MTGSLSRDISDIHTKEPGAGLQYSSPSLSVATKRQKGKNPATSPTTPVRDSEAIFH